MHFVIYVATMNLRRESVDVDVILRRPCTARHLIVAAHPESHLGLSHRKRVTVKEGVHANRFQTTDE